MGRVRGSEDAELEKDLLQIWSSMDPKMRLIFIKAILLCALTPML